MLISFVMAATYLLFPTKDIAVFYAICALLGFANGYWTLFVTIAAEMFGTNLRATVATSAPNFVRGAIIPLTAVFIYLKVSWGIIYAASAVGLLTFVIALIALKYLEETFNKDLNYVEEN